MTFQYLESTLHTLVVAMSDKPRTSFQFVRNNLCWNGMHKISEPVWWTSSRMKINILSHYSFIHVCKYICTCRLYFNALKHLCTFINTLFHLHAHSVGWESKGHWHCSMMFLWEPEGHYCHRLCAAIVPFWFSTEHHWMVITPLLALNWHNAIEYWCYFYWITFFSEIMNYGLL